MSWTRLPSCTVTLGVTFQSNREDPNVVDLASRLQEAMIAAAVTFAKENGGEILPAGLVKLRFDHEKRQ